jgi:hypothetical protein
MPLSLSPSRVSYSSVMNPKDFDYWKQMDQGRRRKAACKSRSCWVVGSLLAVCGFIMSVVGLPFGLMAGFWWVLWAGIGILGLGFVLWLYGLLLGAGIARFEAHEALLRKEQQRPESVTDPLQAG